MLVCTFIVEFYSFQMFRHKEINAKLLSPHRESLKFTYHERFPKIDVRRQQHMGMAAEHILYNLPNKPREY